VPLKVEEQVVVIYAAVKGYLDTIKEDEIQAWEKTFLAYMHASQSSILGSINKEQKIIEPTEAELKTAIENFNTLHPEFHMSE
jgi:F-type H+-transporting ATPase subunit alpha